MMADTRGMVDVCGGKMTLSDVVREVRHYVMLYASLGRPITRMVVDIRRKKDGYCAKIWIPKKCFENGKK